MFLTSDFFARDTLTVARELIGAEVIVGRCAGRIVETEAYTTDAASHSVTRRHTASIMRETFAHIYVYRIYGVHLCLNFTTERDGVGAVLIRAIEPLRGLNLMRQRRGIDDPRQLAAGPGRLCQALAVDLSFNGQPIGQRLKVCPASEPPTVAVSTRIGITQAADLPWRYYAADSPFVSRRERKKQSEGG